MNHPEHDLQCACIRWFDLQYPNFRNSLFAIPNGGRRSAREGARLKAEGVRAGVWDLFLAVPFIANNEFVAHGLFIELKATTKLTDSQKAFREALKENYDFEVVTTLDEFINVINSYLK